VTLEAMQRVVCLLLTDPGYQRRFFSDASGSGAEHGLAAEEFLALRSIDPAKLGIVSEGFMGKRLDALASVLPRTWAALQGVRPGFVSSYLAVAPHPRDGEDEAGRFAQFVQGLSGFPEDVSRFLRDLVAVELLLHETPLVQRLPAHRYAPASLRPQRSAVAMTLAAQGPLRLAWDVGAQVPPGYPADPCHLLVVRNGKQVLLEELPPEAVRLLQACDGQATAAQLADRFGGAEPLLRHWLELGVVEPA
jgi:hypothetical protein